MEYSESFLVIKNAKEVKKAVKAIESGDLSRVFESSVSVKAHILGCQDLIPDKWRKLVVPKISDFELYAVTNGHMSVISDMAMVKLVNDLSKSDNSTEDSKHMISRTKCRIIEVSGESVVGYICPATLTET